MLFTKQKTTKYMKDGSVRLSEGAAAAEPTGSIPQENVQAEYLRKS